MAQMLALQSSSLASSSLLRGAELRLAPAFRALRVAPAFSVQAVLSNKKTAAVPAKKSKVEDGIFGTSGGFGFTKQNELFVGRVAMLGFAASLLGEALTGKGILAQFNLETGIPISQAEPLLLGFILFTLVGAVGGLGDRGRFVDDDEPPTKPSNVYSLRAGLGLNESGPLFGFTKANELFVGRMAQLGFAASLIGEILTGKGALAQLNIETGVPLFELEPLVIFSILFFFVAAINPGNGKFINDEDV
jgi:photosystem II protein